VERRITSQIDRRGHRTWIRPQCNRAARNWRPKRPTQIRGFPRGM